jgi:predicted transcriptional regulator
MFLIIFFKHISLILGEIFTMEYSELKSDLHRLIDMVNDEDTLYQIHSILEGHIEPEHDWYDDISDEMRAAIEEGIADADAGRVIPHEVAMKMIREKYGR